MCKLSASPKKKDNEHVDPRDLIVAIPYFFIGEFGTSKQDHNTNPYRHSHTSDVACHGLLVILQPDIYQSKLLDESALYRLKQYNDTKQNQDIQASASISWDFQTIYGGTTRQLVKITF
ncbi:hypothetical protein PHYBLDRAFT_59811 [Phycomyces blakesleeanus NRRL 1555(-)]|uniref:Uncharacterized protein n=1 Tax=Phycomyces blakesleeanus (strain ATCC 8743b / DSM 1359 / FGSC 10004 / NBRC 33097 / NRRL 1555) TaxID=763407 RepID=A0A162Q187_PHYB8|nr:hypothetical protein PHYBLDRAFT_59811 [Phycomyces blakesleeanus NRRL 1555(-)]OAD76276.1 hypothetical protein PHYBLDRAFT_59811 [Phycomyces blakesleeanus NRRL 1555(-)]|eukprot:XP_018294316.1 hypothetical protein PHYBLDRAFT_59811 [Phycomyces blakesleeanus NRRL 1555(-)]